MDFEDDEVVPKDKESGFLEDDSSFAGIFSPEGFEKGLPQDLSEIGKQIEGEDDYGDNQLDQGVIEDTSDDRGDAGGGLGDILRDEALGDQKEAPDLMRRVHKFTAPLLTPEEIELAKRGDAAAGEEVIQVHVKSPGKGANRVEEGEERKATNVQESESTQKEHTEFERVSVQSQGWRCSACPDQQDQCALQSYCAVF